MEGPLYDSFSAKLSCVIRNGDWCWPAARSETLGRIKAGQSGMELATNDKVIWLPTADHNLIVLQYGTKLEGSFLRLNGGDHLVLQTCSKTCFNILACHSTRETF